MNYYELRVKTPHDDRILQCYTIARSADEAKAFAQKDDPIWAEPSVEIIDRGSIEDSRLPAGRLIIRMRERKDLYGRSDEQATAS